MRLAAIFLFALTACAEFPELDARISPALADAPVPALVPLAPLLAQANGPARVTEINTGTINNRVAALTARAARLRGPVIPAPARARMLRGVR